MSADCVNKTTARKLYQREYYLRHRVLLLARSRARYAVKYDEIRLGALRRYRADLVGAMLGRSRQRAKKKGIEFSLTRSDIVVPSVCPVLGLRLQRNLGGTAAPNSPSLDRIDPAHGYVPGNVQVISYRANAMKSDASREELKMFAEWVLRGE